MKKSIIIIAAHSSNRVIGRDNKLPWRLPADMEFFAKHTTGHNVIMGRKTWESIPLKFKPLPNRRNIVISKTLDSESIEDGVDVFSDFQAAIDSCNDGKIFICGGSELYKLALPIATELYLTEVHCVVDGDTYFPEYDKNDYHEGYRKHHPMDEKHKYSFDIVGYTHKHL